MRVLYHFPNSQFSRRTRLAIAHKQLEVDAKNARADDATMALARKLTPQGTMPVLVDGDRVIGDSTYIAYYLDQAYPDQPKLIPSGAAAAHATLSVMWHIDNAINGVIDLATRYFPLRNDPAWEAVKGERLTRAQTAIDAVAALATKPHFVGDTWSAADIWVFAATHWYSALPGRIGTQPAIADILSLGFKLPESLVTWMKQHESRPDVRAIYT